MLDNLGYFGLGWVRLRWLGEVGLSSDDAKG